MTQYDEAAETSKLKARLEAIRKAAQAVYEDAWELTDLFDDISHGAATPSEDEYVLIRTEIMVKLKEALAVLTH